jgi:UDP-glucuronate 4-epimerase
MRVLVTGAAGFIGFHVARALLARGDAVTGFDNVNDYYDVGLKEARLAELDAAAAAAGADWAFVRADLADAAAVDASFADHGPFARVIHLAAQAGVRYSLENPVAYVASNVLGFTHVLEACRRAQVGHLTYASTSSVYGANATMPFTEAQGVDHPLQFYAATKRANELMAHAYSHLYRLPTTGLRFFTVYGPWGRPDMAPMAGSSPSPTPTADPTRTGSRRWPRRRTTTGRCSPGRYASRPRATRPTATRPTR